MARQIHAGDRCPRPGCDGRVYFAYSPRHGDFLGCSNFHIDGPGRCFSAWDVHGNRLPSAPRQTQTATWPDSYLPPAEEPETYLSRPQPQHNNNSAVWLAIGGLIIVVFVILAIAQLWHLLFS